MDLKLLLKRGALLAAANWPAIAIQFAAQTTFQVLVAVPVIAAAILVAVLLGGDLAGLLQGSLREMLGEVAEALGAEPVALAWFAGAFAIVLVGGSLFMFLVKGGTVSVLLAASDASRPIEQEPLTSDTLRHASHFTVERFMAGCGHLFRRYAALGLALMLAYAASAVAYLAFVVFAYQAAGDPARALGYTFAAALTTGALVIWITTLNLIYLLMQIAIAVEDVGLIRAARGVGRFVRTEFRELGGIFLVVLAMLIGATFASALAWSGVGLIAFVPLVGLAVFPLQLLALVLRGLVFEYIGLTALGAYLTLYRRHVVARIAAAGAAPVRSGAVGALG